MVNEAHRVTAVVSVTQWRHARRTPLPRHMPGAVQCNTNDKLAHYRTTDTDSCQTSDGTHVKYTPRAHTPGLTLTGTVNMHRRK
jgi:hypothetical protein